MNNQITALNVKGISLKKSPSTLQHLLEFLRANPSPRELTRTFGFPFTWDALPNFGGSEPLDTRGVWSWDETSLLVGACSDELYIEPRVDRLNDELQNWVPHQSPCLFRRRLGYARPKRSYIEQFADRILDQVDYSEILDFYVVDSNHKYNVYVLMDSENVHFIHCSQNEFPSPEENVIGVIATTRGENSFLWENIASYDEDGRLIIETPHPYAETGETGEVISDVPAFQAECVETLRWCADHDEDGIYDNFRSQLREQLLARLGGAS